MSTPIAPATQVYDASSGRCKTCGADTMWGISPHHNDCELYPPTTEARCDVCKRPLYDCESVQLWKWVMHPRCEEEAHRRLMRFWDWLMSDEFEEDCHDAPENNT